jgi:protein-S-isoprenylcysteine O-methyltransferase Ste14
MLSRIAALAYGAVAYALFLFTFLYAIGFVAGALVPKHIDSGAAVATGSALMVNLALLALFALQHSGMARPAFKRWWTRLVPASIERSTYVLLSSLILLLLFWQWRPLPMAIWQVDSGAARLALYALSGVGWLLVLTGSFLINHFELFGLKQAWHHGRSAPATGEQPFVTRAFYRIVRHPLMLGFLIAFWATPTMTAGHLLFALATTGYILIAVKYLEERDLVAAFGDTYRDYQRQVPMLLPVPGRSRPATPAVGAAVGAQLRRTGA